MKNSVKITAMFMFFNLALLISASDANENERKVVQFPGYTTINQSIYIYIYIYITIQYVLGHSTSYLSADLIFNL